MRPGTLCRGPSGPLSRKFFRRPGALPWTAGLFLCIAFRQFKSICFRNIRYAITITENDIIVTLLEAEEEEAPSMYLPMPKGL